LVGPARPYRTIQAAVNAARPGDMVRVDAGTYQEQVVIGPGKNGITLQSAQPLAAVIQAPPVMASPKAVVEDSGAQNVALLGFTVTGPGGGPSDSIEYGVRVDGGGSMNISGNHITQIHDTPFGGSDDFGVGILVGRAAEGQTGTATISNNAIDDYQKAGVVVDNAGSSARVFSNIITGVGPTAAVAQIGVQVSNGATGTVDANTISQNISTSPFFAAVGVLVFNSSGVQVTRNQLSSNDVGVYVLGGSFNVVAQNQISQSTDDGIDLDGTTRAQVTNNTVTGSGVDGIALFDNSTMNTVSSNTSQNNGHDGIFVDAGSVFNTFTGNRMSGNGNLDAEDLTAGSQTGGTGNSWSANMCTTDNKGGALCH
jgi:parallel beta-helix repeat protein